MHERSMSLSVLPAGRCATLEAAGLETGMTSEQSVSARTLLPRTVIFAIAASKRLTMSFWLSRTGSSARGHTGEAREGVLTDEGLPLAGCTRVAGELEVGLEADFTREGREHLAIVGTGTGESNTLEQGLDRGALLARWYTGPKQNTTYLNEELGVEDVRRRVERQTLRERVDVVSASDRVAGVGKPRQP